MPNHTSDPLPQRALEVQQPEALIDHACLYMNAASQAKRWELECDGEQRVIQLRPAMVCDDFHVLLQACADGAGICLLPDYLCREALVKGGLVRVLPAWSGKSVDVFALYPGRKSVTPKLRAVIDFFIGRLDGQE